MADEPTTLAGMPAPEPPAPLVQSATPSAEPVSTKATKVPKCPRGHELVIYLGAALHKVGTGFCPHCGSRHPLKG